MVASRSSTARQICLTSVIQGVSVLFMVGLSGRSCRLLFLAQSWHRGRVTARLVADDRDDVTPSDRELRDLDGATQRILDRRRQCSRGGIGSALPDGLDPEGIVR